MNSQKTTQLLVVLAVSVLVLSGCSNLQPVVDRTRFFLLTAAPPPVADATISGPHSAIGIGRIGLPDYLLPKQIAQRKGGGEIQYSDTLHWAERLDKGIQRVLGDNLNSLLGTTNVILSAWRRSEVYAEVYVTVQSFESDEKGRVLLEARWQISNPGADVILQGNFSRISKQGPSLVADPVGAAATLSEVVADLSREIAAALRALPPATAR
jgi:uncharacterized lipoprotein YmbA